MLTSDHALESLSSTPPPPPRLTPVISTPSVTLPTLPCAFFSVPHKMSHVPSLDISRFNSSDFFGFTEPTSTRSTEFERNGSPSSGTASSPPLPGSASPAFGRNKRKNFQPRCITDELLSDSAEMQSSPDHEGNNDLLTSDSRLLDSLSLLANPSLSSTPESLLAELVHSLGGQNGKSAEQPLDLSGQEQVQRSKLAELILLKNIRNLAAFYPQLSSDNTFSPPRQEIKPESTQPTLSLNELNESFSGSGNVFSSRIESDLSEPVMGNREGSLEEFLHLYNVNRDHYLRLFQSHHALQQQQIRGAELEEANNLSHRDAAETEDLESQASAPEANDKDQREECESSSLDDTPMSLDNGTSKTIDIDKLKQLQQLYRLNLMQQIESNKSLLESSISSAGTDSPYLPSLDSPFQKSLEGNSSRVSDQNNSSYIKDLFNKSKASSNKTTSRRPLSSWKQSISACGPGPAPWVDKQTLQSLGIQTELINKSGPIDYTHYVKRYANALECGNHLCKELHYREHFHCNALSCNSRVFMKKEEMIRHFKWHKKRDESLTHGFLRCSPCDNCAERFLNCPHHRKQTHYHCLKRGCDKVYISTSDVQMHANYHRKDTAIIQEGFQRFRATENCLLESCAFFGQKTTHFHCRRDNCNHTFKNKADMEKHKSYHIRDEQLARDGFKKFMKHETCTFDECRSSRVCNHIHCIRPGCTHVLHSTGQLYPHKRKHERRENELAYRKYRLAQMIHRSGHLTNCSKTSGINLDIRINEALDHFGEDDPTIDTLARQLPLAQISAIPLEDILGEISESRCLKYIQRHAQRSEQCHFERDQKTNDEHFSCLECRACWAEYSGALDHSRQHVVQEEASKLLFEETTDMNVCNAECPLNQTTRHLHCRMYGCISVVALHDKTLSKLDHYRFHEENLKQFSQTSSDDANAPSGNKSSPNTPNAGAAHSASAICIEQLIQMKFPFNKMMPQQAIATSKAEPTPTLQVFPTGTTLTSVDGLPILKRKRGRPPKNRTNELLDLHKNSVLGNQANANTPFASMGGLSALELANALNLPLKHASTISNIGPLQDDPSKTIPIPLIMPYLKSSSQSGFYVFDQETLCPDVTCIYFGQKHFHCSKPRCYYSTNRDDILLLHSKDFHDNIDIMEGFVYFDENVDCKLTSCPSNKSNKHFHCTRAGCNFSFVRYSTMSSHEEKHRSDASNQHQFSQSEDESEMTVLRSDEPNARFFQAINDHSQNESPVAAPVENINLLGLKSDTHENNVGNQNESEGGKEMSMLHSLQKLFHEQAKSTSTGGAMLPSSLPSAAANSADQVKHPMYSETNPCNSPFCKLKRRSHYHCNTCNQAFSSLDKLLSHSVRHLAPIQSGNNSFLNSISTNETEDFDQNKMEGENSIWNNLQVHFAQNPALANNFLQLFMSSWMNNLPTASGSPGTNSFLPFGSSIESSPSNVSAKKHNLDSLSKRRNSFSSDGSNSDNSKRLKLEEDTLESTMSSKSDSRLSDSSPSSSYLRFRFNEDCGFTTCVYREHQTHFHCMRKDCGYSFCDKTRFVQHTARHERLDTLMGGDFQQFRSTVNCGQAECPYVNVSNAVGNKTSHFHCLKCDYVCADTNKVVAHRRQHAKMDNISAAGFEKFAPGQDCQKEMCNYKLKQTHYHCLTCHYSVLGLSQMSSHKLKHQQQQQQQQHQALLE